MNRKRIQEIFSKEEYNEFLELGKILKDNDFSKDSNKKEVFDKTLKNINEYRGEDNVKKDKKS